MNAYLGKALHQNNNPLSMERLLFWRGLSHRIRRTMFVVTVVILTLVYSASLNILPITTIHRLVLKDNACYDVRTLGRTDPYCRAENLIAPRPNISTAESLMNMCHAFDCLLKHVVAPYLSRKNAAIDKKNYNYGKITNLKAMQVDELKVLAENQLNFLNKHLYRSMTFCRVSAERGRYISTSSELLARLSSIRKCPKGVAICAVVKNEAAYIQEWLAFHLYSGVDHFHLYLNGDDEDTIMLLEPFIEAGLVTVNFIEGEAIQMSAYDRCLTKTQTERVDDWISFQDVDEFLFRTDHGCLMDLLSSMDDRAALTVNWRMYTLSNEILQLPRNRLLIESNVQSADEGQGSLVVKSIAHVDRTLNFLHPHFGIYKEGWSAKDEHGNIVAGPYSNDSIAHPRIRMHHYHKRSYLDFLMKRLRGRADIANATSPLERFLDDFLYDNTLSSPAVDEIRPAFNPVRHILGLPDYF